MIYSPPVPLQEAIPQTESQPNYRAMYAELLLRFNNLNLQNHSQRQQLRAENLNLKKQYHEELEKSKLEGQKKVEDLKREQDRLEKQNLVLEKRVDNLTEHLKSAEANCSTVQAELNYFNFIADEEKKKLEENVKSHKVRLVKLDEEAKRSKDSHKSEVEKITQDLNKAESKVQLTISQLEKSSDENNELLRESLSLKNKIQMLEDDKLRGEAKIKSLEREITNLSKKLSDNELSMTKLDKAVESMGEKLHYFMKRAETYEEKNDELKEKVVELEDEIEKLLDEIEIAEKSKNGQGEIPYQAKTFVDMRNQLKDFQRDHKGMVVKIDMLNREKSAQRREIEATNQDIKKLKEEVNTLTGENQNLSEKVTELQAKEEKHGMEKSSIIMENKTAVATLNSTITALTTKCQSSFLTIKKLESELEELKRSSLSEQAELSKKVSQQVKEHQNATQTLLNKQETNEEFKEQSSSRAVDKVEVVEKQEQPPHTVVNELPMEVEPTVPPITSEVLVNNSINNAAQPTNRGIVEIDLTGDSDGDNELSETAPQATTSVKKNARKLEDEGDQHQSLRKRLGLDAAAIDPAVLRRTDGVSNWKLISKGK
ncbi:unnamed protein product [Orchesella dallaii]